jgi:hypothetical protein
VLRPGSAFASQGVSDVFMFFSGSNVSYPYPALTDKPSVARSSLVIPRSASVKGKPSRFSFYIVCCQRIRLLLFTHSAFSALLSARTPLSIRLAQEFMH